VGAEASLFDGVWRKIKAAITGGHVVVIDGGAGRQRLLLDVAGSTGLSSLVAARGAPQLSSTACVSLFDRHAIDYDGAGAGMDRDLERYAETAALRLMHCPSRPIPHWMNFSEGTPVRSIHAVALRC